MNPQLSAARGLADVSQRELRDLVRALDSGWLRLPCTDLTLSHAGVATAHCPTVAHILQGCDAVTARALVEVVLAERVHRPPPRLELVWTGPEALESTARDTSIVVRQLFERAAHNVIIGGFRFDSGEALFRPLHERMQRGLEVSMFVDIEGHSPDPLAAKAYAQRSIAAMLEENWPFGAPFPEVYYDPRCAIAGPPWVSLHAKCIVVDDSVAFVTSANFTDRGQTRNLEVGVCIEGKDFAEQLAAQWRTLIGRGLVDRYDQ